MKTTCMVPLLIALIVLCAGLTTSRELHHVSTQKVDCKDLNCSKYINHTPCNSETVHDPKQCQLDCIAAVGPDEVLGECLPDGCKCHFGCCDNTEM